MLRIDEYGGQTITERKDGWFDNDVEGTQIEAAYVLVND